MSPASVPDDFSRVNELFAREMFVNRNAGVVDSVYTAGAKLLPPGAPMVTGRDSIRAFWQAALEALQPSGGKLETVSLEMMGDVAVEVGRATVHTPAGVLDGKYVVMWKREDGSWKLDTDIWNLNS